MINSVALSYNIDECREFNINAISVERQFIICRHIVLFLKWLICFTAEEGHSVPESSVSFVSSLLA